MALFVVANVAIPLCCAELYPFTNAALFSDAPRVLCDYEITAPSGEHLPNMSFGISRQYWGLRGFSSVNPNPHPRAIQLPTTIDRVGQVPSKEEVTEVIQQNLRVLRSLEYVEVQQRVLGAIDENRVGVTQRRTWRVYNPDFSG